MGRGKVSKAERRTARKLLGPLKSRTLAEKTRKKYFEAIALFLAWLEVERRELPGQEEDLDEEIQSYAEVLWEEGEPKALLADLLSGLKNIHERLSGFLKGSWRLYTVWCRSEVGAKATPMTRRIARAMAGKALQKRWFHTALQILVGFECLLRTAELCSLTPGAFEVADDCSHAVLFLEKTKGQARTGVKETVPIVDQVLCSWLQAVKQVETPGTVLGEGGSPGFRKQFAALLKELDLQNLGYQPYSLRRGGATALFSSSGKYDVCCELGRWRNVRTARGYIDQAMRDMAGMKQSQTRKLDKAEAVLRRFLKE